ncbi:MAG: hypothetical protein HN509_13925 [Halobacteriovoraceae bacterium]|jgi:hypothetical protein|nr:hypothetical protein [Halobacteriovoraceae bacterium]MBT5094126.1 hypothetical protein [Halobacteriovoraceae bacterium]
MSRIFLLLSLLFSGQALSAGTDKAPPAFNLSRGEGKAVFVDFTKATYSVSYNVKTRSASARTEVQFNVVDAGFPIFDLVPEISKIWLDGELVSSASLTLPDSASKVRYIKKAVATGKHTMVIENSLSKNVSFSSGKSVKSAYWMSDLSDRRYLEQYLPTNLEFDQYKMELKISVVGSDLEHRIYSNGSVTELSRNNFEVVTPDYFTASSFFFHLTPVGAFKELKTVFTSIDGRKLPIEIYSSSSNLSSFKKKTLSTLRELEADYGPFPHQKIVIYGAGSGGMEYCGATMTSLWALSHELTHSYFARGIMPARGNAGWVDEAIASWRDDGYPQANRSRLNRTRMAGHSIYRRTTDRAAYSSGAKFMAYLDGKFENQGGLKKFLKEFKDTRLFDPFLTGEFEKALEQYFNTSLKEDFATYIYGASGIEQASEEKLKGLENPYHPKLSQSELFNLL